MLALAEVMLMGGIERKESRGSHYRTDYPDRVDDPFLASTVAKWNEGSPSIEFEPVQLGIVEPRAAPTARSRPHNKPRQLLVLLGQDPVHHKIHGHQQGHDAAGHDFGEHARQSSSRSPDCRSKHSLCCVPRSTSRQQRPQ